MLDVTDAAAMEQVMDSVGTIGPLFTPAGGVAIAPFTELTEERVRAQVVGQYRTVEAATPRMPEKNGPITLMSGYLFRKVHHGSVFAAVNGAVEALVKSLAIELAPLLRHRPGPVDTRKHQMSETEHRAYREEVSAQLPIGRPGEATLGIDGDKR